MTLGGLDSRQRQKLIAFLDLRSYLHIAETMFTRTLSYFLFSLAGVSVLSAAELAWNQMEVHVEMTPNQKEARATYKVTNQGDKAVRISQIKTSCGCTGSVVARKIIPPGQSTEIVGIFHRGKRQGLNRNRLQVFLDNQPDAVATLIMSVKIPDLIEVTPQFVYWSKDSAHTERRVRLKMDARYIDEIVDIQYDEKTLKVTEGPGDRSTNSDLTLVIEPLDYNKLSRGTILIKGSGPEGRKHDASIHVFVQP